MTQCRRLLSPEASGAPSSAGASGAIEYLDNPEDALETNKYQYSAGAMEMTVFSMAWRKWSLEAN